MAGETDYAAYGQFAWMYNADPTVKALIDQASAETWPAEKLAAAIKGTPWWQSMVASDREWQATIANDPRQALELRDRKAEEITKQAEQMGITLRPGVADSFADSFYRYGWNEIQLENSLLSQFTYEKGKTAGLAATTETELRGVAADYLVNVSDATMQEWIVSIEQGRSSIDTFKAHLAQQVAASNPWMRNQLDQGFTVRAIMEQPLQTAAAELGINPKVLDLSDPKWRRLLEFTNEKGERVQPTESQIQNLIRTDTRYGWDKSSNANEVASQAGDGLLRMFGKIA